MSEETITAVPAALDAGNGNGYLSADQLLANAPKDIVEEDVDGVFGGKVRIRSLTAAQVAQVNQAGFKMRGPGQGVVVTLVDAEVLKFHLGVIHPKLDRNQAMHLHQNSGPSFTKVLAAIDDISGTSDDELKKAQVAFQGSESS